MPATSDSPSARSALRLVLGSVLLTLAVVFAAATWTLAPLLRRQHAELRQVKSAVRELDARIGALERATARDAGPAQEPKTR